MANFALYDESIKGFPAATWAFIIILNVLSIICVLFEFVTFYLFMDFKKSKLDKKLIVMLAFNDFLQAINNLQIGARIWETNGTMADTDSHCQADGFFLQFLGYMHFMIVSLMCAVLYLRIVKNSSFVWPEKIIVVGMYGAAIIAASVPMWGFDGFIRYGHFSWWCYIKPDNSPVGSIIFFFLPVCAGYAGLLAFYGIMAYYIKSTVASVKGTSANKASNTAHSAIKRLMLFLVVVLSVFLFTFIYHIMDTFQGLEIGSPKEVTLSFIVCLGHGLSGILNCFVYFFTDKVRNDWRKYINHKLGRVENTATSATSQSGASIGASASATSATDMSSAGRSGEDSA